MAIQQQRELEAQQRREEKDREIKKRIKQMKEEQRVIELLEDSYFDNKHLFDSIWHQSELPLKLSIQNISQKFLIPIKINLSQKEKDIALSQQNQLIIGRSGTGKTTTAMIKLTSMQMSYDKYCSINHNDNLRVCFTTVSDFLKIDVQNFYRRIMPFNSQLGQQDQNKISQVNTWPLFTNIRQLIFLIDGDLAIPFLKRDQEGSIVQNNQMEINLDDRLRVRLQTDSQNTYTEVGIREFADQFWRKIRTSINSKNIDVYIVYSQIHSYITGHPLSHKGEKNMIPLQMYQRLVGKNKTHLETSQKDQIYQICLQYQQWKIENRYFDFNDLVNYNLKCILEGQYYSSQGFFHYLFVDEVQDLNTACLYLLSLLTEQSVYLGGDTAQTINHENAFRFTDLKEIYVPNGRDKDIEVNQVLQQNIQQHILSQNFRSHGQIIELNNVVVQLLETFFPTSIDHLTPEISFKQGPKPILLTSRVHLQKFLSQDQDKNAVVDYFGRLQIYIVKDKDQKKKLQDLLKSEGKKGQVFTVLESKGLEFQDVVTYNLFTSTYVSTNCWNALQLLKIQDEKMKIEEFKNKFKCQVQGNFEGSTFSIKQGNQYVNMKTFVKKENYQAQIDREYSEEFNKLIGELKNIYVAISRARSRIFIYEDNIFVGKQKKNPIIQFFESLNLLENRVVNEDSIQNIINDHLKYIIDNEPIKNNREQFQQLAQQLFERKQYLDAAYYYEIIGDELNQKICIAKDKISSTSQLIEQNSEQYEKQKKQILEGQLNKDIKFYNIVQQHFMEAIELLQGTDQFELIAQVYYKLGQYNEAIKAYKKLKQFISSQEQYMEKDKKLNLFNTHIKYLYFLIADLLEIAKNDTEISKNYEELEQFLEGENIADGKVLLYISFRLQNVQKLFKNLIIFKQKNLIEKEELISTLHYYYPIILAQELQKINEIATNTAKEDSKQLKIKLGETLVYLINNLIIPFEEEFLKIAKSRQNMEYFDQQIQFFNTIANTYEFKQVNQDQNIITGNNLMMVYVMLIHFNFIEQQKQFNQIVQSQDLSHFIFIEEIYSNRNNNEKITKLFEELAAITWIKSGKKDKKQIQFRYQYFYAFLGQQKNLKLQKLTLHHNNYFEFTLDVCNNVQTHFFIPQNEIENLIFFQFLVNSVGVINQQGILDLNKEDRYLIKKQTLNQLLQDRIYQNTLKFIHKINQLNIIENVIDNLYKFIQFESNKSQKPEQQFAFCQDNLFCFLKYLQNSNLREMIKTDYVEKIMFTINFILKFNFDYKESNSLIGEQNLIFIDAFCSCFGFISPYPANSDDSDHIFNYWKLIGCAEHYLVCQESSIMKSQLLKYERYTSPIVLPEYSKVKIINRKMAILLCQQLLGEVTKNFISNYASYLIIENKKQSFYQTSPQYQITYPFQILFLNETLKKLVLGIDQHLSILKQNIPKKHAREHEIQTINQIISQNRNNENIVDQEKARLQIFQKLLNEKQNKQNNEKSNLKRIQQDYKQNMICDKQINIFKNQIIEYGLLINRYNKISNSYKVATTIDQFLLEEASTILARSLKQIENSLKDKQIQTQSNQETSHTEFSELKIKKGESQITQSNQFKIFQELVQQAEEIYENAQQEEFNFDQDTNQNTTSEISKIPSDAQEENEGEQDMEEEKEIEDVDNQQENMLESCDDILYVITILNMRNQKNVISKLLPNSNDNELVQFTNLCLEFFQARQDQNRIQIGLKSLKIISDFKSNINKNSQIKILQIGLVEILQLLVTINHQKQEKSQKQNIIKLIVPNEFEHFYTYSDSMILIENQQEKMDIKALNFQLYQYFNQLLDIFLDLELNPYTRKTISNKITYILIIFLKKNIGLFNDKSFKLKLAKFFESAIYQDYKTQNEFRNVPDFENSFNRAFNVKNNSYLLRLFRKRFYKTLLSLLNKDAGQDQISIQQLFIAIRYSQIQYILFNVEISNIYQAVVQKLSYNYYEEKNQSIIDEESKIIDSVNEQKSKLKIGEEEEEDQVKISEQDCIQEFYRPDFVSFVNQQVFSKYNQFICFGQNVMNQLPQFQHYFLECKIQIQKVRKIFLQELNSKSMNSSEKFVYLIEKLIEIATAEQSYHKKLTQDDSFIYNNNNFEEELKSASNECIDKMTKLYIDYLNYLAEQQDKIEKTYLDPKKFIQEQIDLSI